MSLVGMIKSFFMRPTVNVAIKLDRSQESIVKEEHARKRVCEVTDDVLGAAHRIRQMAQERGP